MGGRGEENGGEGMRCPKSRLAFRGWTWGRGHSDLFVEKTTGPPPPFLCAAGTRTLRPVPRGHPQIRKHGEKIRPVARLPGEGASGRQADACRVLRLRKSFAQDSCVCVCVCMWMWGCSALGLGGQGTLVPRLARFQHSLRGSYRGSPVQTDGLGVGSAPSSPP